MPEITGKMHARLVALRDRRLARAAASRAKAIKAAQKYESKLALHAASEVINGKLIKPKPARAEPSSVKKPRPRRLLSSEERAAFQWRNLVIEKERAQRKNEADPDGLLGEWRPVPGYEGIYEVSDRGRIRTIETGLIHNRPVSPHGYVVVTLHKNGVPKSWRVHRLVALAFLPNPENKPDVNHIDCDRANNVLSNLEWATKIENMGHSKRLAVVAYERAANIVREHALDYPDNPRVQEALSKCEERIRGLTPPLLNSIGASSYKPGSRPRRRPGRRVGDASHNQSYTHSIGEADE